VIVLDSHVLVWLSLGDRRLSARARQLIDADDEPVVSAITVYEVERAVARGRVEVEGDPRRWLARALAATGTQVHDVTQSVACRAAGLPDSSIGDPADRLIISTALELGVHLVTRDERLRKSRIVDTVW